MMYIVHLKGSPGLFGCRQRKGGSKTKTTCCSFRIDLCDLCVCVGCSLQMAKEQPKNDTAYFELYILPQVLNVEYE